MNITHFESNKNDQQDNQDKNNNADDNSPINNKRIIIKKKDKKIIDDSDNELIIDNSKKEEEDLEKEVNDDSDVNQEKSEIETLKEVINSLLFYKIDMPASSSNRSILNSLEKVEEKLNIIKNCNTYIVITLLIIDS